jgi:hypothetical protein
MEAAESKVRIKLSFVCVIFGLKMLKLELGAFFNSNFLLGVVLFGLSSSTTIFQFVHKGRFGIDFLFKFF